MAIACVTHTDADSRLLYTVIHAEHVRVSERDNRGVGQFLRHCERVGEQRLQWHGSDAPSAMQQSGCVVMGTGVPVVLVVSVVRG